MWYWVPTLLVLWDYFKTPIDRLYFQNPWRPLLGMQNTIRDILSCGYEYKPQDFPGLFLVRLHFNAIRHEFITHVKQCARYYFHDVDPWADKNPHYYFYKVQDFPKLYSLIKQIPCVHEPTAIFAVMDGPTQLPPHRAESNALLRYHITIEGGEDSTLYTEKGSHTHKEGEDFIFDHSRYHELQKYGTNRRVVLILDVNRS